MDAFVRDAVYGGIILWVIGYVAVLLALFYTPDYTFWGKVSLALYIPGVFSGALWYFKDRNLALRYYAGVGLVWCIVAVVLDQPFIVLRYNATGYYAWDVYLYYLSLVAIPMAAGIYLNRTKVTPEIMA